MCLDLTLHTHSEVLQTCKHTFSHKRAHVSPVYRGHLSSSGLTGLIPWHFIYHDILSIYLYDLAFHVEVICRQISSDHEDLSLCYHVWRSEAVTKRFAWLNRNPQLGCVTSRGGFNAQSVRRRGCLTGRNVTKLVFVLITPTLASYTGYPCLDEHLHLSLVWSPLIGKQLLSVPCG